MELGVVDGECGKSPASVHECKGRSWFFVDAAVSADHLRLRNNALAVNMFICCCNDAILLAKCVLEMSGAEANPRDQKMDIDEITPVDDP